MFRGFGFELQPLIGAEVMYQNESHHETQLVRFERFQVRKTCINFEYRCIDWQILDGTEIVEERVLVFEIDREFKSFLPRRTTMSLPAAHWEAEQALLRHDPVEALVNDQLQPLYLFLNSFFEDPQASLQRAHLIFRSASARAEYTVESIYRSACIAIRDNAHTSTLLSLMDEDSALCWLLKELAGLRYNAIGVVLRMGEEQVKAHVATARAAMVPLV